MHGLCKLLFRLSRGTATLLRRSLNNTVKAKPHAHLNTFSSFLLPSSWEASMVLWSRIATPDSLSLEMKVLVLLAFTVIDCIRSLSKSVTLFLNAVHFQRWPWYLTICNICMINFLLGGVHSSLFHPVPCCSVTACPLTRRTLRHVLMTESSHLYIGKFSILECVQTQS